MLQGAICNEQSAWPTSHHFPRRHLIRDRPPPFICSQFMHSPAFGNLTMWDAIGALQSWFGRSMPTCRLQNQLHLSPGVLVLYRRNCRLGTLLIVPVVFCPVLVPDRHRLRNGQKRRRRGEAGVPPRSVGGASKALPIRGTGCVQYQLEWSA
ncbi:hypothetical protein N656DRAFT_286869 [Canariomyces notabilis]|uniref:Uncharacterized protein n=1 Tax=Canariomyces notabilis TaxID=2074819 RepID=A0AAN6QKZ2_9PEZI|nr:hypothetical protein N656DRAFT_286869 [Canariomyces arenarius]